MLVLLLIPCVVGLDTSLLHCQSHYWFIMLLVQLVHHIVGVAIGSSCYDVNVLLVNHIVPMYIHEPLVLFFLHCWLLFSLVRYYPHHHCLEGGKLMVPCVIVCLSLLSNHHCHLPLIVLLSICRVVGVIVGSLRCLCFGELLPPPIALCKWCNSHVIKKKGKKLHIC